MDLKVSGSHLSDVAQLDNSPTSVALSLKGPEQLTWISHIGRMRWVIERFSGESY